MKHDADIDALSLRCLVAAVGERSVTRAARSLGMGQPTLSHVLARLRRRFNDPLLVRSGAAMTPTPRALALVDAASDVLGGMRRLHELREGFEAARDVSRFVVTGTDYLERLLAPVLMDRLRAEAPGVCVEWRTPDPKSARLLLESGEVDLRLAWVHEPWPGLRFARLSTDRLVCLAREAHPQVGRRLTLAQFMGASHVRPAIAVSVEGVGRAPPYMTLEQYLGLPLGGRAARRPASSTDQADSWQTHRGATLRVAMLAQSFLAIPDLVAQTDLLATVPHLVLKASTTPDGLRVLAPPVELPALQGAMYWHERTHRDSRHRWFRKLLAGVAKAAGV